MLRAVFFPLFLFFLLFSAIAQAGIFSSSDSLRYRVTVTVDTPDGLKTGSAVREAGRYSEMSALPEQGGVTYNVLKGEAVVVNLGHRGTLFSLMCGQDEAEFVFKSFYEKDADKAKKTISYPYAATFTFRDLNDPKTLEGVETSHLERTFGTGVALKSVTVERTDDPVTWGEVDKLLPWVQSVKMSYLSGKHISGPLPYEELTGDKFIVGSK